MSRKGYNITSSTVEHLLPEVQKREWMLQKQLVLHEDRSSKLSHLLAFLIFLIFLILILTMLKHYQTLGADLAYVSETAKLNVVVSEQEKVLGVW